VDLSPSSIIYYWKGSMVGKVTADLVKATAAYCQLQSQRSYQARQHLYFSIMLLWLCTLSNHKQKKRIQSGLKFTLYDDKVLQCRCIKVVSQIQHNTCTKNPMLYVNHYHHHQSSIIIIIIITWRFIVCLLHIVAINAVQKSRYVNEH